MSIFKYTVFLALGSVTMFLVGPAVYREYGTWSLIINPILGFCLGWTAMDMADKIK